MKHRAGFTRHTALRFAFSAILTSALVVAGSTVGFAQQGANIRDAGAMIGRWLPGARGILGTVTVSTPTSLEVRLADHALYTVHFDANTRIFQQPAKRSHGSTAARPEMHPITAAELHPGDSVAALGEVNDAGKSVGAVVIVRIDPSRVGQLKTLEASYGKTWLAGSITKIQGTQITILGAVDRLPHLVTVNQKTRIRHLRESITLADLQPGQLIRISGAMRGTDFAAREIRVMPSRRREARSTPAASPQ